MLILAISLLASSCKGNGDADTDTEDTIDLGAIIENGGDDTLSDEGWSPIFRP